MSYADQMRATAEVHAAYLRDLEEAGFTRTEAFALVRDHHGMFLWASYGPEGDAPSWLGSPHESPAESPNTVRSLSVLKPPTREQ